MFLERITVKKHWSLPFPDPFPILLPDPKSLRVFCAEDQDRTGDPSLFRRMLYQLSYLGYAHQYTWLRRNSQTSYSAPPNMLCALLSNSWKLENCA